MNHLPQIERIKIKLRLAKLTDAFEEAFGAKTHHYDIGPPLKREVIEMFEKKYQVQLPLDYKLFFTQVGHGTSQNSDRKLMAGPNHGLFSLNADDQLIFDETGNNLSMIPFFSEDLSEAEWDKYMDDLDQITDDEENDRAYAKAYGGLLIICESGCLSYEGLILKGKLTSQIVSITYEHDYIPLLDSNGSFLNWYEKWLDEIINGSAIFKYYMYQEVGDENYHVNKLIENYFDSYWISTYVGRVWAFEHLSQTSIDLLWECLENVVTFDARIQFINLLTKFDYDGIKKELKKLLDKHPIHFLRNLHLFAPQRTQEWIAELKQLESSSINDKDVQTYLEYVTLNDV